MALYIFSDAHLGTNDNAAEKIKLSKIDKLFELIKKDGERLIILGDLFEFWFEYKTVIPKEHQQILFMLSELLKANIKIDYVSGNHDFWMDDFFERHLGINVYQDSYDFEHDNLKYHCHHGDGLAQADKGYRLLKKILRNRLNIWLYRKLPPDWAIPLAKFVALSSRNHTSKRYDIFSEDYENYAENKINEGYDIIAMGHLHIPILKIFEKGTYVNSGDFIEHFSYVKIVNKSITIEYIK